MTLLTLYPVLMNVIDCCIPLVVYYLPYIVSPRDPPLTPPRCVFFSAWYVIQQQIQKILGIFHIWVLEPFFPVFWFDAEFDARCQMIITTAEWTTLFINSVPSSPGSLSGRPMLSLHTIIIWRVWSTVLVLVGVLE